MLAETASSPRHLWGPCAGMCRVYRVSDFLKATGPKDCLEGVFWESSESSCRILLVKESQVVLGEVVAKLSTAQVGFEGLCRVHILREQVAEFHHVPTDSQGHVFCKDTAAS